MSTPHLIHNETVGKIISDIIAPTIKAGGTVEDVLVLLESVVAGVIYFTAKAGHDDEVIDFFVAELKKRVAEMRLKHTKPEGTG